MRKSSPNALVYTWPVLRQRLLLGPLLIALIVGILWADATVEGAAVPTWLADWLPGDGTLPPGTIVFLCVAIISIFASRELAYILRDKGILASVRLTCAAAFVGLLVSCLVPSDTQALTSVAIVNSASVLVLLGSLVFYSRKGTFSGVVAAAGGTLLAFVYLGLLFGFILAIRREHSAWVLLWVLFVPKAYDTGAYFTGRAFGRHKLIPWLSPGKTWEGLAGGIAMAALGGALGAWAISSMTAGEMPAPVWGAVAGAFLGAIGQAGDLVASLFKRDAGLKDSSNVLPGFGGVLDVVDSPLLVGPFAYWWLAISM